MAAERDHFADLEGGNRNEGYSGDVNGGGPNSECQHPTGHGTDLKSKTPGTQQTTPIGVEGGASGSPPVGKAGHDNDKKKGGCRGVSSLVIFLLSVIVVALSACLFVDRHVIQIDVSAEDPNIEMSVSLLLDSMPGPDLYQGTGWTICYEGSGAVEKIAHTSYCSYLTCDVNLLGESAPFRDQACALSEWATSMHNNTPAIPIVVLTLACFTCLSSLAYSVYSCVIREESKLRGELQIYVMAIWCLLSAVVSGLSGYLMYASATTFNEFRVQASNGSLARVVGLGGPRNPTVEADNAFYVLAVGLFFSLVTVVCSFVLAVRACCCRRHS
uniref:Uncharacterized protein n=1 Tax=Chromera velia CCMP2878 TaxID=1169474 RepID=A0A0G4G904_9ALVE|eukprot:Cvel_20800.t1-p1 / transcript=Cvel_20800.t1 / gene=Cvel_20800 / organism=Chromera_velia_CCMP2878 / gene_product=hypothetical protein / transcript_product=hypothetical protein / location=Cvel_scaffold1900:14655-15638(-) / protein_length=328 / sequence_SO=supercontig / SO=protein_coding / is_pseudo=false